MEYLNILNLTLRLRLRAPSPFIVIYVRLNFVHLINCYFIFTGLN